MFFHEPVWLFPLFAAVQIMGLASAWLARASQSSDRHQSLFQFLFFVALMAVGGTAIAGACLPSGIWLLSGITLPVMIVGTTCDFRRTPVAGR
jgi:hypothetical protein